jgi:hypothetical protein
MKNILAITAAILFMLAFFVVSGSSGAVNTAVATTTTTSTRSASLIEQINQKSEPLAPMAVSQDGNNVYIVWRTNKSENWEVMFRASNDGGATFGDKINLSNSTDAESQNGEIVAAGENNLYVTWWETNAETGSSESVLRASTDAGQTFGPVIMLGTNGTITTAGNTTAIAVGE